MKSLSWVGWRRARRPRHNGTRQLAPDGERRGWAPAARQAGTLLVSATVLVLAWGLLVRVTGLPAWLLPSPADVARRFGEALADGTLRQHVVPTLIESIGGFVLALLAGTTLGYVVAQSPALERWIAPYVAAIQAIPVIAIAPLIIIWLGYSSDITRNTVVAAIVVVFPIFSSTIAGVRGIPRELREVSLVEGAGRRQRLWMVELPLALPVLLSGVRTSLAYATTGAVVGEFIGSRYGLGALINIARGFFDTPMIFVALLCLVAMTLVFSLLLRAVERPLLRWYE